jgi:hypothetical protein
MHPGSFDFFTNNPLKITAIFPDENKAGSAEIKYYPE